MIWNLIEYSMCFTYIFGACRGKSASTNTYGDRAPFLVRRGAEVARRADRGDAHKGFTQLWAARMRKTLLLLCGFVLCSCSGTSTNPYFPLRRAFLLLYTIFILNLSLH